MSYFSFFGIIQFSLATLWYKNLRWAARPLKDEWDFVDDFSSFDESLWLQESRLYCNGECALMKEKNLHYKRVSLNLNLEEENKEHHELEIKMQNDCYSKDECCNNQNECAIYTSGAISSNRAYHYGSFRFWGKASPHSRGFRDTDNYDIWSCFTLGSTKKYLSSILKTSISICIPSQSPYEAVLGIQFSNEDEVTSNVIQLDFNAAKTAAIYRIDWHPTEIKFYIQKQLKAVVNYQQMFIPDQPLHIQIGLQSQMPDEKAIRRNIDVVQFQMVLFRVKYTNFHIEPTETELFVMPSRPRKDNSIMTIGIILLATFLIMFILWWHFFGRYLLKEIVSTDEEFYISLNE